MRKYVVITLLLAIATAMGCVRGDRLIAASHAAYNDVLQSRLDEELLLNLVRLRYRDRPLFLQLSSVIARFKRSGGFYIGGRGGVDGAGPDGAPVDAYGEARLSVAFEENPTVTFTPLQGEDFAERLLRPIDLETLTLLQRSGWSIERVLRLTVQRMNGLDNASAASGPTPVRAPGFRRFLEASRALKELQDQLAVVIGSESSVRQLGASVPADRLTPAHMLAAAESGYRFEEVEVDEEPGESAATPTEEGSPASAVSENRTDVVLRSNRSRFVLRINAAQREAPTTQRFREVLGLASGSDRYDLLSAVGAVEDVLGPEGERERIVMVTRSLLGVFFFLSHAVEIPSDHVSTGLVTATQDESGAPFSWSEVTEGLLRIQASEDEPVNAAVAVPYRGYWFYIDDDDLSSKSTFSLLSQLYDLQAGDPVAGSAPVPTIPL